MNIRTAWSAPKLRALSESRVAAGADVSYVDEAGHASTSVTIGAKGSLNAGPAS